jgi:hypothetical protein
MALEADYDERLGAMYDALRGLLRAPSPDAGALAAKLELVVAHEVGTLTGGEACLGAIWRDARRLAGGRGGVTGGGAGERPSTSLGTSVGG